ncbi:MAG TPA: GspE/PulE family protein [Phycisphaerae bacterium]|nr:GspE/PulE family protein [Phycisphaerae bacterium]
MTTFFSPSATATFPPAQPTVPPVAAPAAPAAPVLLDVTSLSPELGVDRLLEHAVNLQASDVCFCVNEQHVLVQARHLGMMRPIAILSPDYGKRAIALIKTRANLDLTERRRPQDGRWIYTHGDDNGTVFDLRIAAIPTAFGEDLSVRLLDRTSKRFTLDTLGLLRAQRGLLASTLEAPGGLVLFTGPTGSGKTATLYACLQHLNTGKKKINTIEDPIEYTLEGVRQSQVNPAIDLNFSDLLRAVMRQSPDVIMIGEIRDPETAGIAIRAANSGHMVLATIHATAAAGAVQSMRALGVHSHFLATALRAVVAQRLVRTLCPKCRTAFDLADAPHTFDEISHLLSARDGKVLWAPRGCEACLMSGYAGRTGVFELMPVSRTLRNLIAENHTTREIRQRALAEKMIEFRHAALMKVALGETSTEEVFRAIPTEHLIADD